MSGSIVDYLDICSLCELATESIQKNVESGNYDGAHIQLCAYLLEIHSRYLNSEINFDTWKETLSFYRRMTMTVIEESNIQERILLNTMEGED